MRRKTVRVTKKERNGREMTRDGMKEAESTCIVFGNEIKKCQS